MAFISPTSWRTHESQVSLPIRVARWPVYFQTKNPDLGKIWRALQWSMLVYYMAIWSNLQLFGIFCGNLVHFVALWYILWPFGIFHGYLVYLFLFWYVVWHGATCNTQYIGLLLCNLFAQRENHCSCKQTFTWYLCTQSGKFPHLNVLTVHDNFSLFFETNFCTNTYQCGSFSDALPPLKWPCSWLAG
jgi:hypothetical protein